MKFAMYSIGENVKWWNHILLFFYDPIFNSFCFTRLPTVNVQQCFKLTKLFYVI